MELITSEQRDELITAFVERDAFHLELKDTYATAIEDGPFAKWLKGEPDDFAWLQPLASQDPLRHTGRQNCTPGQGYQ